MPEEERLLKFEFPKLEELEAYVVKLPDGTLVVRTKEELEKMGLTPEKKE